MISEEYLQETFVTDFAHAFQERRVASFSNGAETRAAVFPVAVWPRFLVPADCRQLRDEVVAMDYSLRSSDLYEFHQTVDLKHACGEKHPHTARLCRELYGPAFRAHMERITGRRLGPHVDISAQRYERGDFLLCHDDRLERRRIALVLYLVEETGQMQGGRLLAMRSDEDGRPVAEHPEPITPHWNTLVFFEVTRASFHQVEQIQSADTPRFSIACWFHDADDTDDDDDGDDDESSSPLERLPTADIFPVRFKSVLSREETDSLMQDMERLGRDSIQTHLRGRLLSSAQYAACEPEWMKRLLHPDVHRLVERLAGVALDWPTRPVAWRLDRQSHGFLVDLGVDSQADAEYNYRERRVVQTSPLSLHLTLVLRFDKRGRPLPVFMQLHTRRLCLRQLPRRVDRLILVCMRFVHSPVDLRK